MTTKLCIIVLAALWLHADAFVVLSSNSHRTLTKRYALWRHLVPRREAPQGDEDDNRPEVWKGLIASAALAGTMILMPSISTAISGGGLDYAGLDISGQDFANANYKGKDFSQTIAKGTIFAGSNLQGCRFYKAYLVNADFSGTDLRGASLEDTSMDGASLKDANAAGAYFSASIYDSQSLENADFTDAQMPMKTLALVCERDDVKGTNPTTGADTRESLMCP